MDINQLLERRPDIDPEVARVGLNEQEAQAQGIAHEVTTYQIDDLDRAIADIGFPGFGLSKEPPRHEGQDRPGRVVLWRVLGATDEGTEPGEAAEEGEEGWLSRSDRKLADKIAQQVKAWMDPMGPGFPLVKEKNGVKVRRATPGDVMVLVRKRKELAGLDRKSVV